MTQTIIMGRLASEIELGERVEARRVCAADDLLVFAHASGDSNPIQLPSADKDGDGRPDQEATAPAMWIGALIAALIGERLPGPGARLQAHALRFHASVGLGDEIVIRLEVIEKAGDVLRLRCVVEHADARLVADGEAEVICPKTKLAAAAAHLPSLSLHTRPHFERLLDACAGLPPMPVALAAPEEEKALGGALLAWRRALIIPILVGDPNAIRGVAKAHDLDIEGLEIVPAATHEAAAAKAVDLVRQGRAHALMKGALHTDELLHAVLDKAAGLRAGRRLTHVFVFDAPGVPHLLFVSDAAINIAPDLETKADIVQNAIDLARALGVEQPKAGILCAVETVTPKMPATLDAAALSKMADRGQIKGGLVDGPLAMDNAVDIGAAKTKGVRSLVAGRADILIAPNIEAGNILVKELSFISRAEGAGLVLGAAAPIILTSRSDDEASRLMSCAIAVLYAKWKAAGGK